VRNHARSVLACDFFVAVTTTFRVVYVFVILEVDTRRIVHWNLTAHPTADWTGAAVPNDRVRGCRSLSGITKSKHSRRIVPTSRSQNALA
jgi:hypothetical protein